MDTLDTKNAPKSAKKYYCCICDVNCCKKSDLERHILTDKHKKAQNGYQMDTNGYVGVAILRYTCICGKEYKYSQGLSKHKKTCFKAGSVFPLISNDTPVTSEVFLEIIKQNHDFKELIIEQTKQYQELQKQVLQIANKSSNVINNNTMNNSFNLNFFLNETCKDAMNLTDFVDSLQLTLKDLETTGKLGYEEGISKIFINGLKELEVNKRPIHCTDTKREKLYVKDKDNWENDQEKERIRKAIRKIANKNVNQINDWIEANPDSQDYDSKKNDQYLNIVLKATGGSTKEEEEKRITRVISSIAKHVEIDKSAL
uniref:C2H2-type domain-containing protein n=1 Tax=viral metagenome TaxID=1070528 RepID=A0A6C0FA52_9ZZZZ